MNVNQTDHTNHRAIRAGGFVAAGLWMLALSFALLPVSVGWAQADAPGDRPPHAERFGERPHRPDMGGPEDEAMGPMRDREGREQHRGDRSRWRSDLSDEKIDELMVVMKDIMPQFAERVGALREENPVRFRMILHRLKPELERLLHDRAERPELYQLKVQDRSLNYQTLQQVGQLRDAQRDGADESKINELKAELRQTLVKHFEVRQKLLEAEVKALEERIAKMREHLAERAEQRDQLIGERVEELMSSRRGPKW